MRRGWRWGVVAGLLAVLAVLPGLAGLLPADAGGPPPQALLAAVRDSARVPWSGYGESTGTLAVPDVRALEGLPELVGGTTRARAWWRGPQDWRVDTLSHVGETDVVVDATGTWQWQSADRRAVRVLGDPAVRLPRAADAVAPVLGRRLARTPGLVAEAVGDRRVAGRPASGLRLRPRDPDATTVDRVDLWVEPRTGLALRVEVHARGQARLSFVSSLLDLDLAGPPPARTAFTPPPDADVEVVDAPDLAGAIDRFAPFALPDRLAGLPRTTRVGGLGGGVATYGEGLTALVLLPLPGDVGRRVLRGVDPADDDGRGLVATPLVGAAVGRVPHRGGWFVVAGTVPAPVLERALDEVLADPPRRVR